MSTSTTTARLAAAAITAAVLLPVGAAAASAHDADWSSREAAEYSGTFANKDKVYEAYLDGRSRWEQAAARVAAGDRTGTLPAPATRVVHVGDRQPWGLAAVGSAGVLIGALLTALSGRVRRLRVHRPARVAAV